MIIDRIPISGPGSYFYAQSDNGLGDFDSWELARPQPTISRTPPMKQGQQWQISGIHMYLQAEDLIPLFLRQEEPIMKISLTKEMFPGHFSDPFSNRVHTISGFVDFNKGTFENCKPLDIEGVPTLVSVGSAKCIWRSQIYILPNCLPGCPLAS